MSCLCKCAFFTLFLVFFSAPALSDEGTAKALYQEGLGLFQKEKWPEAEEKLSASYELAPENAPLLYNLGLTKFQLEKYAEALAMWRKALTLNSDLNLAKDGVIKASEKLGIDLAQRMSPGLERVYRMFTFPGSTLTSISVLLFFFLSGWTWLSYLGKKRVALARALPSPRLPPAGFVFLFLFVYATTGFFLELSQNRDVLATVVSENISARSTPSSEGTELFDLQPGTQVRLHKVSEDWVQAHLSGGLSGWIMKKDVFQTSKARLW